MGAGVIVFAIVPLGGGCSSGAEDASDRAAKTESAVVNVPECPHFAQPSSHVVAAGYHSNGAGPNCYISQCEPGWANVVASFPFNPSNPWSMSYYEGVWDDFMGTAPMNTGNGCETNLKALFESRAGRGIEDLGFLFGDLDGDYAHSHDLFVSNAGAHTYRVKVLEKSFALRTEPLRVEIELASQNTVPYTAEVTVARAGTTPTSTCYSFPAPTPRTTPLMVYGVDRRNADSTWAKTVIELPDGTGDSSVDLYVTVRAPNPETSTALGSPGFMMHVKEVLDADVGTMYLPSPVRCSPPGG